ncbi:MAG: hypothetical protein A3A65_04755 [Candidatus Chisholmbacteria bacterium RIFCSPLOWO2_01_FULL_49_14]|uniref:Addiction module toxin, HicA family n=1 Tax=Candidatus Chisholmbacteria bacterium RIFCSPLOWO2_01_FULL_49_14 TaxID=1797593 RepID=A0A1G1W433_9BACT|nr:MAG: hypothetical protein A3A65_04755 [Candidatus Chisholmbacteria bacterium RIFCSPLOWO2_01_FULL_49_14]
MPRLPTISSRKFCKFLEGREFIPIRQSGSHRFYKHKDGRTMVVPIHTKKDIGRGLLRPILRDANISPEEFVRSL